ncbi:MAG: GIY-YIG nuclease family protein, partial [Halobacteriovoraceae bacterium]|nr:GIY-YIG nuclease family protein [Halobacteriovoraceae bacterium]
SLFTCGNKQNLRGCMYWYCKKFNGDIEGPLSNELMTWAFHYKWIGLNTLVMSNEEYGYWHRLRNSSLTNYSKVFFKSYHQKSFRDLLSRKKWMFGVDACSLYILQGEAEDPVKIGISSKPKRRLQEHRNASNINYKLFEICWLKNREEAKMLQKNIIKLLHKKRHRRSGSEFFHIRPETALNALKKCFLST